MMAGPLQLAAPTGERVLSRSYPGTPERVGVARRDLAAVLDASQAIDVVVLCASELMTNALRHSRSGQPGGYFTLTVDLVPGQRVTVCVADEGGIWQATFWDGADPHGMGLSVVIANTTAMGIETTETGRRVWFSLEWAVP